MNIEDWKSEYIMAMVLALTSNPDWTETHATSIAELCANEISLRADFNSEEINASDEAMKTISGW